MGSVFTFVIVLVLICFAYDLTVKYIQNRTKGGSAEDTKTLQEIHKGLMRLEDRVEALETIVIDRSREQDFERKLSS